MSYSVLKKGKVIISNLSTQREAQNYIDERCGGFFGDNRNDYEIRDDSGCYLTSAAVDYMNLADDCDELTTLRDFRDTYLVHLPSGEQDIKHYYSVAPTIVQKINASQDKSQFLNDIYHELIEPCVELIKSNRLHEAYLKYKEYTLILEHKLLHK
ncbi:CFI-box-CTERM domain-containing protein [Streptococcus sp. zg-JUN1979]|uniref:CFI-box-CTERM domain-containing protein n=1 Tax=Streptococcus sp. zg-JUN1979 TaxID=3391450 RepID=UPI0039A4B41E